MMKSIAVFTSDYIAYVMVDGVAVAVDKGNILDYLIERVTKMIQNIIAGSTDTMVGYYDSTPSYDEDGHKQLCFYRMRIFSRKQLEDAEITVMIKEMPTPE